MLGRYKIWRGKRPADDPQPEGVRQDSRKHTRHCLRPPEKLVHQYQNAPGDAAWERFERGYLAELDERFATERAAFDELAALATDGDVFIGCSCPTVKNPDPARCHTILALRFMKRHYPKLKVTFPAGVPG